MFGPRQRQKKKLEDGEHWCKWVKTVTATNLTTDEYNLIM
jgi:hypothetical protein